MTTQITYKRIAPFAIGGAGNGNTYRFEVTRGDLVTISTCERDVAYSFRLAGLRVPAEIDGPYDGYGHKVAA